MTSTVTRLIAFALSVSAVTAQSLTFNDALKSNWVKSATIDVVGPALNPVIPDTDTAQYEIIIVDKDADNGCGMGTNSGKVLGRISKVASRDSATGNCEAATETQVDFGPAPAGTSTKRVRGCMNTALGYAVPVVTKDNSKIIVYMVTGFTGTTPAAGASASVVKDFFSQLEGTANVKKLVQCFGTGDAAIEGECPCTTSLTFSVLTAPAPWAKADAVTVVNKRFSFEGAEGATLYIINGGPCASTTAATVHYVVKDISNDVVKECSEGTTKVELAENWVGCATSDYASLTLTGVQKFTVYVTKETITATTAAAVITAFNAISDADKKTEDICFSETEANSVECSTCTAAPTVTTPTIALGTHSFSKTAEKSPVYARITLTNAEDATLYFINRDADGGCNKEATNFGYIQAKVTKITAGALTCEASETLVTFKDDGGSWKGCEVLTYEAPTPNSGTQENRYRFYITKKAGLTEPSGRGSSSNSAKALIAALDADTTTSGATTATTAKQDICFTHESDNNVGTPGATGTECTCTAAPAPTISLGTTVDTWVKGESKAIAYGRITLTGAAGATLYYIDTDAAEGCHASDNFGYIHAKVTKITESELTCETSENLVTFKDGSWKGCEEGGRDYVMPAPRDGTQEHFYKFYLTTKTGLSEPSGRGGVGSPAKALSDVLDVDTTSTASAEICFISGNTKAVACTCTAKDTSPSEGTTTTTAAPTTAATTTSGAKFYTMSAATAAFAGLCLVAA